jgi:hypothetical protein
VRFVLDEECDLIGELLRENIVNIGLVQMDLARSCYPLVNFSARQMSEGFYLLFHAPRHQVLSGVLENVSHPGRSLQKRMTLPSLVPRRIRSVALLPGRQVSVSIVANPDIFPLLGSLRFFLTDAIKISSGGNCSSVSLELARICSLSCDISYDVS